MSHAGFSASYLRTEYLENPIGIDVLRPRLSWIVTSGQRNKVQTAYQILVASAPDTLDLDQGDLWDTGRVESGATSHIVYGGVPLEARQQVWWKVRCWNGDDQPSGWSAPATWELGFLKLVAWRGAWIEHPGLAPDASIPEARELDALLPASLFRRSFEVDREVTRARLYATARGVYEPRLNGARVGDQVLAPGWTAYNRRIQVQAFDVTDSIRPGENVVGAEVGTGWYAGYVGWKHSCRHYGATPQVLMQLHLDYRDGTSEVIATDAGWTSSTGAVRYSDFIMGEYYDARLEQPGWDAPGFGPEGWRDVRTSHINAVPLVGDCSPPVRALDEIEPVSIREATPGVYIFDLGQNITGLLALQQLGRVGSGRAVQPDGDIGFVP